MRRKIKILFVSLLISLCSSITFSDPWFTGPILAAAGHTIPRGHTDFEIYGFDTFNDGEYNGSGHLKSTPLFHSVLSLPLLTHGFNDWMDVQVTLPYVFNSTQGVSYNRLADLSAGLGLQLFEQKKNKYMPSVRLFIQETFPTGKFEQLNPLLLGTDATGLGSFRTLASLNLQYLAELPGSHYLRSRLILAHLFSSPVHVMGFNSFGGEKNTDGIVNPGDQDNIDVAFELTLTQHWVAVMEAYYSEGKSNIFDGILDEVRNGTTFSVRDQFHVIGLAPALEYNFSPKVGVIGGVWFPVEGKNTSHFINYVMALNIYW